MTIAGYIDGQRVVYAAQVHITSIGLAPHLEQMLRTLRADPAVSTINLWVNRGEGVGPVRSIEDRSGVDCHLHYEPTNGIYDQWNAALDWTTRYSGDRVAVVLNDDLILPEDAISSVLEKMVRNKEYALVGLPYEGSQQKKDIVATRGTYKDGGMGGFAWAAWPQRCARVAPGYTWWYGDDDLVMRTLHEGDGLVGLAKGTPVGHEASYSARQHPEITASTEADRKHFDRLWS